MTGSVHSTPLAALEGVVLDTETTGLDMRTARLVQIGAVRITGRDIHRDAIFDRLIDPAQPIPATSTAIHGITDGDVAGAPPAGEVIEDLGAFLDGAVVIGHAIGFDLTILKREAARTGCVWQTPRALDVRLLAQAATPELGDHSLDKLCSWFGVKNRKRHTAMGDALATAGVFAALLPLLRERGIRTLAEAEAASRRAGAAAGYPGVADISPEKHQREAAGERIDSYPYRTRVADVMASPPARLPGDRPVGEALALLIGSGISSLFVDDAEGNTGIVTERDILRAFNASGADTRSIRLDDIKTLPLQTVSQNAFLYRAIGRMNRLGVRHLGVTDESGAVVGVVTTRNLLQHRSTAAMVLGDEINAAPGEVELCRAWAKLPVMARRLVDEEIDPRMAAAVISSEIRAMTRRAAILGERRMAAAGHGAPPVSYSVLVLGSGGRGESLLAADQDNAIVYESGEKDGPEDAWFAGLGAHIADILDYVGLPYCNGGVMARNRDWRKSLADWKSTVDVWMLRRRPEDLLNVDIFFDAAPVHGNVALGDAVWAYAYERGGAVKTFWRAMAETLRNRRAPIGMFGSLKTGDDGRIDLKQTGLMPIFASARILSIKTGTLARDTPGRLRGAVEREIAAADQIDGLIDSHRTILGAMLNQQVLDTENGVSPTSRVDPRLLTKLERRALKQALETVGGAIDLAREGVF